MTLVYADDRADLTEEATQRYVLSTATGVPLLTFGTADAAGVMWLADEPEGWSAPAVDLPLDRKQDGHGAYSGEQTYEERPLSVRGSAEAPSIAEAHRARRRLLGAITRTVRDGGYLLWTHLDDEPTKSLYVQLAGQPNVAIDGRWIDYAFVLVASDPIKFGAWQAYGPVRLPTSASEPGRSYTAGLRTYSAGVGLRSYPGGGNAAATVVRVPNDGEEPAPAIYTITGPVPRPRVTVGDEFIELGFDLGPLDVAVIDSDLGTVEVNGVNRYDAFGAGSTFPLIPPADPVTGSVGGAEVRLRSATGGADPAAGLVIETAPRWT